MFDPPPLNGRVRCFSRGSWPGISVRWLTGSLIRSSRTVDPKADVLLRVAQALEALAASLESGRPEAVLDAELPLAAAAGALKAADPAPLTQRPDLRASIAAVRLAVARCQRLGESASAIAAIVTPSVYGAPGRPPAAPSLPATLTTRT